MQGLPGRDGQPLAAVFDHLDDGLAVSDEKGSVIYWNPALELITGIKKEQVLGRAVWDIQAMMTPDQYRTAERRRELRRAFTSLLKTGRSPWQDAVNLSEYTRPDGVRRTLENRYQAVATPRGFILVGQSRDVTDQYQAERSLRYREEVFRSLIEQAEDGIIILNASGVITEWNRAHARTTGIERQAAVGRAIADLSVEILARKPVFGREDSIELHQEIAETYEGLLDQGGAWTAEREVITLLGEQRTVHARMFTIVIHDETLLGCIIRDMSVQKEGERALKRQAEQLETLRRVGLDISSELALETLLWVIAPRAIELLNGGAMALYLHNAEEDVLDLAISLGSDQPPLEEVVRCGEGLAGHVWETAEPVLLMDYHTGRTGKLTRSQWGKVAGAPIIWGGEFQGVIFVFSDQPFGQMDLNLLGLFASHVAAAIRNARLHNQLHRLAMLDPLTGIYNRRQFFILAEDMFGNSRREGKALSCIILDIDFFKNVNDRCGHLIGDDVLCDLVQRCSGIVRREDIFGRYGGEEFTLLLPGTDLDGAQVLAERLRAAIGGLPFETRKGPIDLTVSVGVACCGKEDQTLLDLINRADMALYAAKDRGRNLVHVHAQTAP